MQRIYGWGKKNCRVNASAKDTRFERISVMGALGLNGKSVIVLFLPPYSPDFNPIEMSWSKVKSYLRKVCADTKTTLNNALACAFDMFSNEEIMNWFRHDGYQL